MPGKPGKTFVVRPFKFIIGVKIIGAPKSFLFIGKDQVGAQSHPGNNGRNVAGQRLDHGCRQHRLAERLGMLCQIQGRYGTAHGMGIQI